MSYCFYVFFVSTLQFSLVLLFLEHQLSFLLHIWITHAVFIYNDAQVIPYSGWLIRNIWRRDSGFNIFSLNSPVDFKVQPSLRTTILDFFFFKFYFIFKPQTLYLRFLSSLTTVHWTKHLIVQLHTVILFSRYMVVLHKSTSPPRTLSWASEAFTLVYPSPQRL